MSVGIFEEAENRGVKYSALAAIRCFSDNESDRLSLDFDQKSTSGGGDIDVRPNQSRYGNHFGKRFADLMNQARLDHTNPDKKKHCPCWQYYYQPTSMSKLLARSYNGYDSSTLSLALANASPG